MKKIITIEDITAVYLDELDPEAGRHDPPIDIDCGIFCELNLQ